MDFSADDAATKDEPDFPGEAEWIAQQFNRRRAYEFEAARCGLPCAFAATTPEERRAVEPADDAAVRRQLAALALFDLHQRRAVVAATARELARARGHGLEV